jgi:hypothetical protein
MIENLAWFGWTAIGAAETCRKPFAIGCANLYDVGGCHLYIADDDTLNSFPSVISYPAIYRHEIGHCNGWPADHPTHAAVYRSPLAPIPIPTRRVDPTVILLNWRRVEEDKTYEFGTGLVEYARRRAKELGAQ